MAAELTDILGYEFSNKLLVTEALTHRSAVFVANAAQIFSIFAALTMLPARRNKI